MADKKKEKAKTSPKIEKIIDQVSELSVLELSELVKSLENGRIYRCSFLWRSKPCFSFLLFPSFLIFLLKPFPGARLIRCSAWNFLPRLPVKPSCTGNSLKASTGHPNGLKTSRQNFQLATPWWDSQHSKNRQCVSMMHPPLLSWFLQWTTLQQHASTLTSHYMVLRSFHHPLQINQAHWGSKGA